MEHKEVFCQSVLFSIQRLLAAVFCPCILDRGVGMAQGSSEFSAFPAEVPVGHLLKCFPSHCLGEGFETCPLIIEPVLCFFSFRLHSFIRSQAVCKLDHYCKKGFRAIKVGLKRHCFHFYEMCRISEVRRLYILV